METLDVIEKMQEYDEADLCWGEAGDEWTFYAMNAPGDYLADIEDWHGCGDTPVEAYNDAVGDENG